MHGEPIEFRILGPLEVAVGPDRLELGGVRQQAVLAALLLSVNRPVSIGRLVTAVYGDDPPSTARSQVQISISALRRVLAAHGDAAIGTYAQGYLLELGAGRLDALRFGELIAAAQDAHDGGQPGQAVACYRDALRLWRGPALDGLDSHPVRAAAGRLDEQRIAANEDRLTIELGLGRHHELVGELAELVAEFPLREQLRGQLMLALYRCGRSGEALRAYTEARQTMIEELGIEPGEPLRTLQRAILTADPDLDLPAGQARPQPPARHAPSLLPADIADFTDRTAQLNEIHRLVRLSERDHRRAVPVVVITGQGGVGKTSLAVHASHRLAEHFPDGQLYADLHGGTSRLVDPMRVLERFLRALGVPGAQIPGDLDERAEMYRDLIADRKMLVVLDDVAGEAQVPNLLPGSGTAAVIITSRSRLTGLAGAAHVDVGVLDASESAGLLARIVGSERIRTQEQATAAVASHCGHLPLALRIAGARLSARPHWSVAQLAERLADETRRLDELAHGDLHVRASISLSYDSAGDEARRLFRRLALLEVPVFSGWVCSPLLDRPLDQAQDLLDELVGAKLVEPAGTVTGDQYRFHELIRLFARDRLAAEEPLGEQLTALTRTLGTLLDLAGRAGQDSDSDYHFRVRVRDSHAARWPLHGPAAARLVADPAAWFERERATLVAGVRQAAQAGATDLCWNLMLAAEAFFQRRAYFDDWRETLQIALAAARRARDTRGEAAMLHSSGALNLGHQRLEAARQDLAAAARLFREDGNDSGVALAQTDLAFTLRLGGRLDDAVREYRQVLTMIREIPADGPLPSLLLNMAAVELDRGEPAVALPLLADALHEMVRANPNRRTEAQIRGQMGRAYLMTGEVARAVAELETALALVVQVGDQVGEAHILQWLGVARVRAGELDSARDLLQGAIDRARRVGDRLAGTRALLGLSELALADGDHGQAVAFAREAADGFADMGAPVYRAQALTWLAQVCTAQGDEAAARTALAAAAELRAGLSRPH